MVNWSLLISLFYTVSKLSLPTLFVFSKKLNGVRSTCAHTKEDSFYMHDWPEESIVIAIFLVDFSLTLFVIVFSFGKRQHTAKKTTHENHSSNLNQIIPWHISLSLLQIVCFQSYREKVYLNVFSSWENVVKSY